MDDLKAKIEALMMTDQTVEATYNNGALRQVLALIATHAAEPAPVAVEATVVDALQFYDTLAAPTGNTALVEAEAIARLVEQTPRPSYKFRHQVSAMIRKLSQPAAPQPAPEVEHYRERLKEMKASRRGWIDTALEAREALKVAGDYLQACQVNGLPDLGEASRMPFITDVIKQIDAALARGSVAEKGERNDG